MLNKLLSNESRPVVGRITETGAGIYMVEDTAGRKFSAASQKAYQLGANVVVLDGQIVGTAGKRTAPTVYQV